MPRAKALFSCVFPKKSKSPKVSKSQSPGKAKASRETLFSRVLRLAVLRLFLTFPNHPPRNISATLGRCFGVSVNRCFGKRREQKPVAPHRPLLSSNTETPRRRPPKHRRAALSNHLISNDFPVAGGPCVSVFRCFGVSVREKRKIQPHRTAPCSLHRNTARRSRHRNSETPLLLRLFSTSQFPISLPLDSNPFCINIKSTV